VIHRCSVVMPPPQGGDSSVPGSSSSTMALYLIMLHQASHERTFYITTAQTREMAARLGVKERMLQPVMSSVHHGGLSPVKLWLVPDQHVPELQEVRAIVCPCNILRLACRQLKYVVLMYL
jgi:hypothetical protein